MTERRTQAQRRAETKAAVMRSATKHFGQNGFNKTSLEDIADDCGISIAPIYHYFKNKKNLFVAVNEQLERQILQSNEENTDSVDAIISSWKKFLNLCQDPIFRQIVLIDGPTILGKDRTFNSDVSKGALERMRKRFGAQGNNYKAEISGRMLMAALAEAGLFVGNCDNPEKASQDAEELVIALVKKMQREQA